MIKMDTEFQQQFNLAGERHGHLCPSLCFGVRAGLLIRKLAHEQGITTGSILLEATTKCLKDGVFTVLGDDRVEFTNAPGACRLSWDDGKKKITVSVRADIRAQMGELKESMEPDVDKFQNEGLALLSRLSDDELFLVE